MSHTPLGYSTDRQITAPFRAKSAGVSLFIVTVICLYYFANVISYFPVNDTAPDGALSLMITVVVLIVVAEVVLQVVLFIGAGQIEDRTERDDVIAVKASRNAYFVLTLGAFATFGSMFAGFARFEMGSVLMLAFMLAEVVRFATQVVLYVRHPA